MRERLRASKAILFVVMLVAALPTYAMEKPRQTPNRGWGILPDWDSWPKIIAEGIVRAAREGTVTVPAAVAASVDEFFKHLEQNLARGSAGDRAMENAFRTLLGRLRSYLQEGEEFDRFIGEFGATVQRNLDDGSSIDQAVASANHLLQNFLQRAADDMNLFADEVWLRAIRKTREEIAGAVADVVGSVEASLKGLDETLWVRAWQYSGVGIGAAIATTIGITASYYAVKYLHARLVRPTLIIESSKKSVVQMVMSLFYSKPKIPEMIFSPDLEQRLNSIVRSTINIHKKIRAGHTNVTYRNVMLWGPPGTGKTMFAKRLARESGLEWAYMSGASFAKFKDGEGIEALDDLFKWAKKSKGLLLFIDEADAFLMKREKLDPNSRAYQLLNNFLNYTGERSNKFMLVFATNHKDDVDSAMHRRIDDLVELPLPAYAERVRVLALYREKLLLNVEHNGQDFVDSVHTYLNDAKIEEIAQRTAGLSNGDLASIVYTIKTDADITESGLVDTQIIDQVIERALEKYHTFTGKRRKMVLPIKNPRKVFGSDPFYF